MEQVIKWDKVNDLWVILLLAPSAQPSPLIDDYMRSGIPSEIKDLIHQYGTIFQEPTTLPPFRLYDHSIALPPNAIPVNCMPYMYSLEQKNMK
jgi:hypothetical protein